LLLEALLCTVTKWTGAIAGMPHWHAQDDPRDVWDARDIITINVPVVYMGRDVWIWIGEQSITRGEKWVSPLPNPYVQPHINNRYINSYNISSIPDIPRVILGMPMGHASIGSGPFSYCTYSASSNNS
jgi:hypothetical protein